MRTPRSGCKGSVLLSCTASSRFSTNEDALLQDSTGAARVLELGGILMDLPWVLPAEGFLTKDTAQNLLRVALPGLWSTSCSPYKKEGRMWSWDGWKLLTVHWADVN